MPGASGYLAEEYPDIWKAYPVLRKATADCGNALNVKDILGEI